jgi:hypothetical protein
MITQALRALRLGKFVARESLHLLEKPGCEYLDA